MLHFVFAAHAPKDPDHQIKRRLNAMFRLYEELFNVGIEYRKVMGPDAYKEIIRTIIRYLLGIYEGHDILVVARMAIQTFHILVSDQQIEEEFQRQYLVAMPEMILNIQKKQK